MVILKHKILNIPEELFPNELLGQNKTTPDLINFIEREKEKEIAISMLISMNYISELRCQFLSLFLPFSAFAFFAEKKEEV